jgi:ketosteroid isomerase-like protein
MEFIMTNEEAQAFADEWIAAWNSHDLDRVLSHYAPEVVFLSPIAQKLVGNGRVVGIPALRSYWGKALATLPQLKFELLKVLVGHACLTIFYMNHRNQQAAETFEFASDGKVVRSFACYSPVPTR